MPRFESIHLVRQGYDAFSRGDMTALAEVLHPDVEWFVGGDNALTGGYSGRDATFSYFGRLFARTNGTATVEVLELTEPYPGTVLAMVHLHAEANGHVFDEDGVQQIEVKDGLVVSCRTFLQNGHLYDDLIGRAVIELDREDRARALVR
jgi:uncharacterized protein